MDALPIGFTPLKMQELLGGYCWQYRFENEYGASVVIHDGSYGHDEGLFELLLTQGVTKGSVEWKRPDDTFIRSILDSEPDGDEDGLYGWLTAEDVARILGVIRGYEKPYARAAHQLNISRGSASWDGERVSATIISSW